MIRRRQTGAARRRLELRSRVRNSLVFLAPPWRHRSRDSDSAILGDAQAVVAATPVNLDRVEARYVPYFGLGGTAPTVTVTIRAGSSLRANAALMSAAVTRSTRRVQLSR